MYGFAVGLYMAGLGRCWSLVSKSHTLSIMLLCPDSFCLPFSGSDWSKFAYPEVIHFRCANFGRSGAGGGGRDELGDWSIIRYNLCILIAFCFLSVKSK